MYYIKMPKILRAIFKGPIIIDVLTP